MAVRTLLGTALCALALVGCGGGNNAEEPTAASSGAASATEAATGSATTNATDQPADTTASDTSEGDVSGAEAGADVTQPVSNEAMEVIQAVTVADGNSNVIHGFEAPFTKTAPGWSVNWWGGSGVAWATGRETRVGYVHGGAASQWFSVQSLPAGGGAHFIYSYGFQKDARYTASIWLRAEVSTQVEVQMRRDVAPWSVIDRKRVTVGATWQQVSVSGTYPYSESGSLRVVPLEVGKTVHMDDMAITKTGTAPEPAVGGTNLLAAGMVGETLTALSNSTMEEAFSLWAPGWYYNSFGGSAPGVFSTSRDSRAGYAHSGSGSLKFQVIDKKGGELHLIYKYAFVKGKTYRATAWVRADVATPLTLYMRRDEHPWDAFGTKTTTIGSTWQKLEIEGTYIGTSSGSLRLSLLNPTGTIWVDDVKIEEVTRNDMAPYGTGVVADTLFGMHVNKLGVHSNWPTVSTRIIRLHNTGTTWRELEPTKGNWAWDATHGKRLDMYVDYATKSGGQVLYTLGMTPLWASSTPTVNSLYGMGASGAPKDSNDWRNYVRTLAQRYVGKIRYWELWNEPDFQLHWVGTQAQLVELARIAAEELHAVDPQNRLIGPGFTAGQGMSALDGLLRAGLGTHVDAIGYHFYYSTNPEAVGAQLDNVRGLMKSHGVDSKPLWITEGAFICHSQEADCATAVPTAEQQRSVNARAMFMMALRGVANFNYYTYESQDAWRQLVELDYSTATAAGRAFGEARSWLQGARIVDGYRIGEKVYVVRLTRGTENFVVLWATQPGTVVNLPSAWTVSRVRSVMGVDSTVPANRQMTIGLEPVMLRP